MLLENESDPSVKSLGFNPFSPEKYLSDFEWRPWCNGSIEACGALGPGSIPGGGPFDSNPRNINGKKNK